MLIATDNPRGPELVCDRCNWPRVDGSCTCVGHDARGVRAVALQRRLAHLDAVRRARAARG